MVKLVLADLKYYLLPNKYVFPLGLSYLVFHASLNWGLLTPMESLSGAVAGGAFLLIIRWAALKATGQDALGLGDVKFMAASGFGLGLQGVFLALTVGSLMGILHGVYLQQQQFRKTGVKPPLGTLNVPAGGGLAVGVFIVFLYQFGISWAMR